LLIELSPDGGGDVPQVADRVGHDAELPVLMLQQLLLLSLLLLQQSACAVRTWKNNIYYLFITLLKSISKFKYNI
jgi:hypothetical protein